MFQVFPIRHLQVFIEDELEHLLCESMIFGICWKSFNSSIVSSKNYSYRGGGANEGFDVTKSGDSRVGLVGFPSEGKSTLLNKLKHFQRPLFLLFIMPDASIICWLPVIMIQKKIGLRHLWKISMMKAYGSAYLIGNMTNLVVHGTGRTKKFRCNSSCFKFCSKESVAWSSSSPDAFTLVFEVQDGFRRIVTSAVDLVVLKNGTEQIIG